MHLLLILLACGGKSEDSGVDSAAPADTRDTNSTDDTSAGGDDTAASACAVVTPGTDWAWSGECPQMRTPCDILVADCVMSIDYAADGGPAVDVRCQALFGLARHPMVGDGRVPLTLRLTSPAGRPIQVTRNLPGFWAGSWADVRKDLKGRYPRHPWPENPLEAPPTLRAKRPGQAG